MLAGGLMPKHSLTRTTSQAQALRETPHPSSEYVGVLLNILKVPHWRFPLTIRVTNFQ
jgi:hypothetical protein